MKKKVISKDDCRIFNEYRQSNIEKLFSRQEMIKILRDLGWKNTATIVEFTKLNILTKPKYGFYAFTKEPVYIDKLNLACKNLRKSKKVVIKQESTEDVAIALLKTLGYEIRKPTLDKEEALRNPEKPVKNFIKFVKI